MSDLVAEVDGAPDPAPPRIASVNLFVVACVAGFAGSAIASLAAPMWRHAPADLWSLRVPVLSRADGFWSAFAFVAGVLLLAAGWFALVAWCDRDRGPSRSRMWGVVAVAAMWAVPMALAPPMLSNDVYSYAAQGELQSRGIDPTAHGPSHLLGGDFMVAADPYWRNDPAPYGPVWIGISEAVVDATGHDAATSVWAFRGLALLGTAMFGVGAALIARSYGVSPALALALGIANPLVLLHFVGGSHNDALMAGLLALGLAAARRDRRVLAVVLVALAGAVKLPAAVALPFIGWTWPSAKARFGERVAVAAAATAGGAALVGVLCLIVGIGPGWVFALSGTNRVHSTFSATTKVGHVVHDLSSLVGLPFSELAVVNTFRLLGLLAAAAISAWVLLRSQRIGLVRSVAIVLLVVVLLGPVVWPWYLPASLALLAASGLGRFRAPFMVVAFSASLFVFPSSVDPVLLLLGWEHPLGLAVVVVVAGSAAAAYLRYGRRVGRRPGAEVRRGA